MYNREDSTHGSNRFAESPFEILYDGWKSQLKFRIRKKDRNFLPDRQMSTVNQSTQARKDRPAQESLV